MPGRLLLHLRTMLRVVGGETPEVAEVMAGFYRAFVDADLDLTDSLTAELVKTAENAYRDVNIAFANELALICERAGGDVWKVRDLVNKAPTRHVLVPGAGVGGHCIPKDSWLLAAPLGEDMDGSLLATSRHLNDSMPAHMADLVLAALAEASIPRQKRAWLCWGMRILRTATTRETLRPQRCSQSSRARAARWPCTTRS